ncbi:tetratricopeptide repeat protein [Halalkalibaculum sp. DA3122]|uniref:tetratricopeptide repeat protein n=1 Tax=unclassified Halalkalibaculum TaxID=2964617 RepID=UPI003754765D
MAKRKMTQEELESDPLVQSVERVQSLYVQYKSEIIGGAIALFLIIAGGIGYYYYSQSQERQAQQLMGPAETAFLQSDYQTALNGSDEDFTVGFEQIINNYGGTDAGNLARYYAAVCEYNLGNTERALSYMEDYEVPEGILGVGPLSFMGVLYTDLGQHAQAAQTYLRAAEWDENDATTPYNYLEAASAFYDAGDTAQAREYASIVVRDYPGSEQVPEAERLLGMIAAASE